MKYAVLALALGANALVACVPGTPPPGTPGAPDAPGPTDAATPIDASDLLGPPWRLVWQDEFDGPEHQRPDPTKWRHDVGGGGWGNEQLEFDTDRPENASLDGQGRLRITARRENYGGRSYTSARINTAGKFERAYGRFEARIKLPRGQGIWPAFWALGNDIANAGWPTCGEIDIMEFRGQQLRNMRASLHGPGYSGGANHGKEIDSGVDLSQDFHVYAVEWDPGRVVFKIDEDAFFTATPADLPAGTDWVYDHPFFIILNVAVGGTYVGNPDGSTVFPQTMVVDHVRVYERIP
ncbi:MAG: glycoside hydrolase family 16 protein [Deltaproteobacteria bacterium]|nr:glycoside hydrolase family 16 protein [Kofleriaceae bacterium]